MNIIKIKTESGRTYYLNAETITSYNFDEENNRTFIRTSTAAYDAKGNVCSDLTKILTSNNSGNLFNMENR